MSEREQSQGHVLIVDDEEDLCELLAMRLEHHGFRASIETTGRGALELLSREIVDAIVLDMRLDGEDGLDVLEEVQRRSLDLPVVVLTAHGTAEMAVAALGRGAYGFLTKPFHDHELLSKISHAVERARLRREVAGLRRIVGAGSGDRLLGTSARIEEVRERIARVAPSDATVLLEGESGTGKELAARMLHALSPRSSARFVAINCGALPGELLKRSGAVLVVGHSNTIPALLRELGVDPGTDELPGYDDLWLLARGPGEGSKLLAQHLHYGARG